MTTEVTWGIDGGEVTVGRGTSDRFGGIADGAPAVQPGQGGDEQAVGVGWRLRPVLGALVGGGCAAMKMPSEWLGA